MSCCSTWKRIHTQTKPVSGPWAGCGLDRAHPSRSKVGTLDGLREFVKPNAGPGFRPAGSGAGSRERPPTPTHAGAARELPEVAERRFRRGRAHLLGILPNIAAHLDQPEGSGIEGLIGRLNGCASAARTAKFSADASAGTRTLGSIVAAAAEIAGVAIRTNSRELVEI